MFWAISWGREVAGKVPGNKEIDHEKKRDDT